MDKLNDYSAWPIFYLSDQISPEGKQYACPPFTLIYWPRGLLDSEFFYQDYTLNNTRQPGKDYLISIWKNYYISVLEDVLVYSPCLRQIVW